MNKNLAIALMFAAVAGCDDSKKSESTAWIGGVVYDSPQFQFPSQLYALKPKNRMEPLEQWDWTFSKAEWKPHSWSLWVASNVYSDAKAPRDDLQLLREGFGRALSAAERAKEESLFIGEVSKFVKANKVDLEINYLGYDPVPASLMKDGFNSKGSFLTFDNDPCEKAFRLCVSNYFISPAERFSGGKRLSFKDWTAPYMKFGGDQSSQGAKHVYEGLGGGGSEEGVFYDWWPTMVFLVNPEGKVVRAWLPQTHNYVSVQNIEGAIAHDMGGRYADLKITDDSFSRGVPLYGYQGKYYIENGMEKLMGTFQDIIDTNDR
ncbi:hypothetical protein [Pseudomonas akapageensis]|uniref:hypothetical protein n=1 Tax=Pseudomonas akapageensis TaxID=2609961 RepID=UPI00140954C2|nr:hypothetical protein [Pseudomonas akapageensis]